MENRSPNESKTTVNTATESIAQKIRKEMLGESITEEEYKQAMEQDTDATDEFEYIATHFHDVKEIVIEDDTFTVNKKRVIDICNLLL